MTREEIVEELEELRERMLIDYERGMNDALLFYRDEIKEIIKEIEA